MSSHPSGVGLWSVRPRDGVSLPVEARGHTAFDAFQASRLGQYEHGFSDCEFELVADEAPPAPAPEPSPAMVRRVRRRPLGRLVGAARGAP